MVKVFDYFFNFISFFRDIYYYVVVNFYIYCCEFFLCINVYLFLNFFCFILVLYCMNCFVICFDYLLIRFEDFFKLDFFL